MVCQEHFGLFLQKLHTSVQYGHFPSQYWTEPPVQHY